MELLNKLGIDWKILIAQIINFAILVFILAKFVYRPVLNILEKRSRMIEQGIENAKKSEAALKNIEDMRETKLEEAERAVGSLLNQAKNDAEALKKNIMDETTRQSADLLKRAELQIAEQKEKMLQDVKTEVVDYAITVAGKVLEREFSKEHQQKLSDAITREMKTLV